jgi:hypothetical protein
MLFEGRGTSQQKPLLEDAHDQLVGKDSVTKAVAEISAVDSLKNRMLIDSGSSRAKRLYDHCWLVLCSGNEQ